MCSMKYSFEINDKQTNEMQPIISLEVLLFQVGYGTQVGARAFMRLSELTTYPFEAMSVMTGWGAMGEWHFSDIDGT